MEGDINYNVVGFDSSNLKILNDIYIINGSLFMNGKNTIQDTCNYILNTSNVLSNRIAGTSNYIRDTSNIISVRLADTSNYVKDSSNAISIRITDTSNALSSRITANSNYALTASNALSIRITANSNYALTASNALSIRVTANSNYALTASNTLSNRITANSNYALTASNTISSRITNLNTDNIIQDSLSNNKFIVNNLYDSNLTVNGNLLVTSNLTVGGSSTILNTDVFTTEVLEITNEGGGDVAFKVTQKSAGTDIINAFNQSGAVFKLTSNGNVGIGTDPVQKLDVNGNIRLNGDLFPQINAASNIGSPAIGWSNIYFTGNLFKGGQLFIASNWDKVGNNINYPTNNVGIGSATPTQKLDVAGNINIATGSTYKVGGTDISLLPSGSANKYLIHNGTAWTPADILTLANITGTLPIASGGTGALSKSGAAKNILPTETLAGKYLTYDGTDWISSDILTLTNIAVGTGTALSISKGGTGAITKAAAAINILPTVTNGQYLTYSGNAWVSANIPAVFWTSPEASKIVYTGSVGIGTTTPGYKLDVHSDDTYIAGYRNTAKTSGIGISPTSIIAIGSTTAQNITIGSKGTGNVVLQTNGASQVTVSGSGNVGIGTATISAKLHIAESTGTQRGANAGTIILDHDNAGGASSITFRSKRNRSSDYAYIQYQDDATIGGSGESSRLIIGTENDGDDDILLMPSGNIGVSNSNPEYKLDVLSDDTYIAGYRNTAKTSGIGIGSASIVAIGSAVAQNITIGSKGTGNVVLQTNGTARVTVLGNGNITTSGSITTTNSAINAGTGAITGGATTVGALTCTTLTTNNNAINAGTGAITGGALTCAALTCTTITTANNAINAGTGAITGGALTCTTITTANNAINAGTGAITGGSVGIGAATPEYSLDIVKAGTYIAGFRNADKTSGIGIGPANIVAIGSASTQDITIGSKSTGTVILQTNGTTRVTVSGVAGNVGIGSTVPVYSLDVLSDSVTIAGFRNTAKTSGIGIDSNSIVAIGSATTQNITIGSKGTGNVVLQTDGTSRVTILGGGNVGIGITNPAYNLDVVSSQTYTIAVKNADFTKCLGIGADRIDAIGTALTQNITIGSKSTGNVILQTDSTSRVTVSGNGNVGIGTATISAKLHIGETTGTQRGPNAGTIILDHDNAGGASSITFRSRNNRSSDYAYIQYQDDETIGGSGQGSRLIIGTENDAPGNINVDHMLLMPSGNIGVNNSRPEYKLDVLSDATYIAGYRNTAKTSGIGIGATAVVAIGTAEAQNITIASKNTGNVFLQTNGTPRVTVLGSGFVGIGNIAPSAALHVTGDLVTTGEITAGFSDIRLKDEITLIENPLEMISNINGFYYRHNELAKSLGFSDDKREVGLSAQEVQKVLPEIVRKAPFDIVRDDDNNITSKSGEDYLTICYERLIPVIIESIKELNNEINKLKKENKELRKIISLSSINQTVADI
jgi:hypothetical protein